MSGRLLFQTNANSEILRFTYNPSDQLLSLEDGKNQKTKWNYDLEGRLTNKVDAANNEIFRYAYDANGRLTDRWTRAKGDTAYAYDPVGNLTSVNYPGTALDIAFQYDLMNRLTNVVDVLGQTRFGYTAAGQLLSEDGPWSDDTVGYDYTHRRRAGLSVLQPNASPWTQSYGYDAYARLTNVISSAGRFDYWHNSGASDRVNLLHLPAYDSSAEEFHYMENTYDPLARLTDTQLHTPVASPLNLHTYLYNDGHQRTKQTFIDNNYTDYTYDKIGQLKTAKGWESGGSTARSHEQFGYAYDKAWNLQQRTNNALEQTFGVNNLNELTNATRTGTLTVAGETSLPGADVSSVTVSGTGLSSGAATVYADGAWMRSGATLADGAATP